MDEAFANALRRGQGVQARCLGLNLQTLQVGHLFLLEQEGCAFPYRYEDSELSDLVIGVFICSQSWDRAERALKAWWTPYFMRVWERLTRKNRASWKLTAAPLFQTYLLEANNAPETAGRGAAELKAPLPFRLLAMLMADFHLSEKDALGIPVKRALCLWVTEADRRGTISLLSERQRNFRAWVEEQERIRLSKEAA